MKRKTYTARCQRSGDWWAISVPELRGVHTQARRLEKAEATVRDAIALFLDVPSDSFEVRIEPVLPRDLQGKVGRARKVRGQAEVLQREAAIVSAQVAADLVHTAHLTVRDAGRVLGLSHQRITQLLKAASAKGERSNGLGTRVAGAGRSQGDRSA
ncbi:MAG: type II toxin-antitoxin system HicB family antitoxin [Chloroflexi bacterium]|nr:MAG: type II toxin-antitoxin system HicB family antitoxin [Chloroflexota bacterium]